MNPYAKEYTLSDRVIQDVWDMAKLLLFGSREDNVQYAQGVFEQLKGMGREVELIVQDQRTTLQLVSCCK